MAKANNDVRIVLIIAIVILLVLLGGFLVLTITGFALERGTSEGGFIREDFRSQERDECYEECTTKVAYGICTTQCEMAYTDCRG